MKNHTTLARLKSLVFSTPRTSSTAIAVTPEKGHAVTLTEDEQLLQDLVCDVLEQEKQTDAPCIRIESDIRNHQLYLEIAQVTTCYGARKQLCNFRAHSPDDLLRHTTKNMRDSLKRHLKVMLQLLIASEQHESFSETVGDA